MSFSAAWNSVAHGLWKSVSVLHRDASINSNNGGSNGYESLGRRDSNLLSTGGGGGGSSSSSGGGGGGGKSVPYSTNASSITSTQSQKEKDVSSLATEAFIEAVIAVAASFVVYTLGVGAWNIAKMLTGNPGGGMNGSATDIDQVSKNSVKRLTEMMRRRGRDVPSGGIVLDAHESHIAEDIIDPADMRESFSDIGGLDNLKQEIWELAVLPLTRPELFTGSSKLVSQTSGILLFGKPGCGKTLLAKAIAKESEAIFIPIKLSRILNKWVGESNKLVAATFSLAEKLAPSIIFIDELDTFLSSTVDPSASKSMESLKAEFLTLWDGISTNRDAAPVLVLGATNRPQLIDSAILRRMPRSFQVPLPDAKGREQILRVFLQDQPVDNAAEAFLPQLAQTYTQGYSGSDLKELCKAAAMEPIREIVAEESRRAVMGEKPLTKPKNKNNNNKKGKGTNNKKRRIFNKKTLDYEEVPVARPVSREDFRVALEKVKRTGAAANEYGRSAARDEAVERMDPSNNVDMSQIQALMPQIMAMLGQMQPPNGNGTNNGAPDNSDDVPRID